MEAAVLNSLQQTCMVEAELRMQISDRQVLQLWQWVAVAHHCLILSLESLVQVKGCILNTILRFSSVDAWQLLPRKESSFWPLQPIFLNCSLQRSLRYVSLICSAAGSYFRYLLLHAYNTLRAAI